VAYAKTLGIDFIICDHHRPGSSVPPAVAVLDPKQDDCPYPFKELTGCGVGFKLLQAFCRKHNIDETDRLWPYLDLLVVSIAADIVPIVGENRVLSHFGLKRLNAAPRTGLKALIEIASLKGQIDIMGVVFGLSPRINAAGRIRHANDAVNLLLAEKEQAATDFAFEINKHNTDRRGLDSRITQEALTMIEEEGLQDTKSTVLYRNDWHKGVIGIVASRCIEQYHRPTIILTESNGHAAGSARSVPGFDVYDAIEACAEHLIQFGGHTFAAGLTLEIDKVEDFKNKFEEVVAASILPEQLSPMVNVDMRLPLSQVTEKFYKILNQMQPFGPQNMAPIFVAEDVKIKGNPKILKEKHLKIDVFQEDSSVFGAIGFGLAEYYELLLKAQRIDICYQIDINEFRGERNLQLMLKDIRVW
jgi:single-stranded-DNA-specific exonuclease